VTVRPRIRRLLAAALLAATLAAFVVSGLYWGEDGLQRGRVSKPVKKGVFYVDATVSCDRTNGTCVSETRKNANGTVQITIRTATNP
jgi:hypothetical protein